MQHKLDYARYELLQHAEHFADKARSVFILLRLSLGEQTEQEQVAIVLRWLVEIGHECNDLYDRTERLPAAAEPDESTENAILEMDDRKEKEFQAWMTAFHADNTQRVDFPGAFRILTSLARRITLDAGQKEYGEHQRHRILSAAASVLEMSENVLELLEYQEERKNDTVHGVEAADLELNLDPRYETPGCFEADGVFGSDFGPTKQEGGES